MAINKKHRDIEFIVKTNYFHGLGEALMEAFVQSLRTGEAVKIDVLCHSAAGAKWFAEWAGEESFPQEYRDDPDMSVAQRWTVKVLDYGIVR